METLVVVAHHRNQYCGGVKPRGPARLGSSPVARDYRGMNCRSFESAAGILPSPVKRNAHLVPKQACSSSRTPPPSPCVSSASEGGATFSRVAPKSAPIAIDSKASYRKKYFTEEFSTKSLSFSERWAGPAYSNSPPPSSLPIPKFSVQPKRTMSLELPGSSLEVKVHLIAKSAPASPTRERSSYAMNFFHGADSATEALRRILNLDANDE